MACPDISELVSNVNNYFSVKQINPLKVYNVFGRI